jgi:hypothetical protein
MEFLFVGTNFCRQVPSDLQSPTTPLLLANTPYCKVCSELAPYSRYMPDALKKGPDRNPGPSKSNIL